MRFEIKVKGVHVGIATERDKDDLIQKAIESGKIKPEDAQSEIEMRLAKNEHT